MTEVTQFIEVPSESTVAGAYIDIRRAWVAALVAFLSSRIILLLVGWISLTFIAVRQHAKDGIGATMEQMVGLGCRWDCGWYMSIAQHGYSTISPAIQPHAINLSFWPMFPFLARFIAHVTGLSILHAGLAISNLAFLACLYLLNRYCTLLKFERTDAVFAVFLMAFVPEGFLFSAFYADSLSMLGIMGAMYFARRERWWLAGLFAILASSSRPTGIIVIAFLVVYAFEALGWRHFIRPWKDARPFIPVVLVPAGYFLMLWISYFVAGDAFAEVHTRAVGWGVHFAAPWSSLLDDFLRGPSLKFWAAGALTLLLSLIPLYQARLSPELIFGTCYLLVIFSQNNPAGLIHYTAELPVIYIGFAWLCRKREAGKFALLGTFALVNAALFSAWALSTYISV